ncbi:MAG: RHS repeat-associated core domain-containing protein, partial [Proteobacteria bacterium]|nr:RHS repeat-associated core domain-containing protein [Pseudomonadota bacterium]
QGLSSTLYFGEDFEIINNTSTLYIFAGNLRVAKTTDTTLDYYHKDHLGSTNAISRQDGTIIDSGEYLPYGLDRSANALLQTSAYKFTDQEQDDGTGLYNYDARLYDPVLGQFVMADSMIPDQFNPQSLNRFAYCLDNPVKYIDPSGHIKILGFNFGTTPTFGEGNVMGINDDDGFFMGAEGFVMSLFGFLLPESQPYSRMHDKIMDKFNITHPFFKTVTNIAIVPVLPVFIVSDLVNTLTNPYNIYDRIKNEIIDDDDDDQNFNIEAVLNTDKFDNIIQGIIDKINSGDFEWGFGPDSTGRCTGNFRGGTDPGPDK